MMLFACKAKQVPSETEIIRFDKNTKNEAPFEVLPGILESDTSLVDVAPIDTTILEEQIKKDIYKIAVVLPFKEDSLRKAWNKAKDKNFQSFKIDEESELSISFMEGMILALKDLKLDSKFELTFYDDNNDNSQIKDIIEKIRILEVDVIIGGLNKQNITLLSNLAKSQEIMLLSPFSPSKSAAAGNPRYYMFEPSLEQHLLSMINYTLDSIETPHIKFIYHKNNVSQFYASFISEYIDALNDSLTLDEKIKYITLEAPKTSFKVEDAMDLGVNNVFIVNSFDEMFVHTFLKQLNTSSKENEILTFGMPGWENSQIIRLEYMSNSNIHFTKSSWIDWENLKIQEFSDTYNTKYARTPNVTAFLGYDFASFIFKSINDYGLNLSKIVTGNLYKGLDRNFMFEKNIDKEGKVERIENTNLRIYKIEDFEPILVK
jgi:ABC-type branched-subunit amino acid transport system substrate-binding protein